MTSQPWCLSQKALPVILSDATCLLRPFESLNTLLWSFMHTFFSFSSMMIQMGSTRVSAMPWPSSLKMIPSTNMYKCNDPFISQQSIIQRLKSRMHIFSCNLVPVWLLWSANRICNHSKLNSHSLPASWGSAVQIAALQLAISRDGGSANFRICRAKQGEIDLAFQGGWGNKMVSEIVWKHHPWVGCWSKWMGSVKDFPWVFQLQVGHSYNTRA